MAGSGGSGGPPAPRAGAGPTVIAAALVVLVIGLGWLNHGGGATDGGSTPFARDVSRAIEQAEEDGLIPASEPARPSDIGSSGGGSGRTSTTVVIDPETGLEITINLPAPSGSTGSSGTTGGSTGTTGGGSGGGGTTGTTRPGSSTTDPTVPPTTDPTVPPTTDPTVPPTTDPTIPPTTDPTTPPSTDIIGDLLGGVTGALGTVIGSLF